MTRAIRTNDNGFTPEDDIDIEHSSASLESQGSESLLHKSQEYSGRNDERDFSGFYLQSSKNKWLHWLQIPMRALRKNKESDGELKLGDTAAENNKRKQRRRRISWCSWLCIGLPIFTLSIIGFIHILEAVIGVSASFWNAEDERRFLPSWGQDGLSHYPTDFTRDILPIPCHSHNDYWRRVPLYEGIHYGCTGTEADVWHFKDDDELYVGHTSSSLTKKRTFQSLYVNPLVEILDHMNPFNDFANQSRNGLFDQDASQTTTLLVDFKTDGPTLLPYVHQQLQPLREKGYLTYYDPDTDTRVNGPITVTLAGNAPFDLLLSNRAQYPDLFFDAPLQLMDTSDSSPLSDHKTLSIRSPSSSLFNSTNSHYASVSFKSSIGLSPFIGRFSQSQVQKIRNQIRGAKERGLVPRYWSTPVWPVGVRNKVWEVLVQEGIGMLNVDDLKAAREINWGKWKDMHD